jgi:hypothetical protein
VDIVVLDRDLTRIRHVAIGCNVNPISRVIGGNIQVLESEIVTVEA